MPGRHSGSLSAMVNFEEVPYSLGCVLSVHVVCFKSRVWIFDVRNQQGVFRAFPCLFITSLVPSVERDEYL